MIFDEVIKKSSRSIRVAAMLKHEFGIQNSLSIIPMHIRVPPDTGGIAGEMRNTTIHTLTNQNVLMLIPLYSARK